MDLENGSITTTTPDPNGKLPSRLTLWRKVRLLVLINMVSFLVLCALAEVGLRLFWHPRFWVHADGIGVGSAFGPAGKKWWPESRFRIEGKEFFVHFQSDARGYRARPAPPTTANPWRVAFVGDSFTEAMQVEYSQSFVSRLEHELTMRTGHEVMCENYGVAATGLFDYWHRITHDVFRPGVPAPSLLVLCVFPENDFTDHCPDDGFEPDGQPRRDYFRAPHWTRHILAWCDTKSKLAHFLFTSYHIAADQIGPPQRNAPDHWWNEPAVALAEAERPGHVAHLRSLFRAIEAECGRHGTRLAVLVVPARNYAGKGDPSPIPRILRAWGVNAPVLDVAAAANAIPRPSRLVFPLDGHLNPSGHEFVAHSAVGPLAAELAPETAGLADSVVPK